MLLFGFKLLFPIEADATEEQTCISPCAVIEMQTVFFSLQLNGISPGQGFGVEFLLTLQLVLCVIAVTDKRRDVGGFAPLSIGLSVGLGHLAGVSILTWVVHLAVA